MTLGYNTLASFRVIGVKIMSHVTKVTTEFKDLEALKAAFAALQGMTVHEGDRPIRYYYGKKVVEGALFTVECDSVYDIAVVGGPAGTYTLDYDPWNRHIQDLFDAQPNSLKQVYAEKVIENNLPFNSVVQRQVLDDGAIRLQIQSYA